MGISSGANLIGAIRIQQEMGPEARVLTILCDCNKKYLSTDLVRKEPIRPTYIAPRIEFTEYRPISRLLVGKPGVF